MSYRVSVTREGDLWLAEVDGVSGGHTLAESLDKLDRYVREVIVLGEDLPDEAAGVLELEWGFEEVAPQATEAAQLARTRRLLDAERADLVARTQAIAHDLVSQGWSVRDVAAALGPSPGRVSQLTGHAA